MDAIAIHENELLHLGVPAPGLVPEVDARFQELFHRNDVGQKTDPPFDPPLLRVLGKRGPKAQFFSKLVLAMDPRVCPFRERVFLILRLSAYITGVYLPLPEKYSTEQSTTQEKFPPGSASFRGILERFLCQKSFQNPLQGYRTFSSSLYWSIFGNGTILMVSLKIRGFILF